MVNPAAGRPNSVTLISRQDGAAMQLGQQVIDLATAIRSERPDWPPNRGPTWRPVRPAHAPAGASTDRPDPYRRDRHHQI
jgi:hypothetical protein